MAPGSSGTTPGSAGAFSATLEKSAQDRRSATVTGTKADSEFTSSMDCCISSAVIGMMLASRRITRSTSPAASRVMTTR